MSNQLYIDSQKQFIDDHSLKVGDKVKVVRAAKTDEMGWNLTWLPTMNKAVGNEFVITELHPSYGIALQSGVQEFWVTWFVIDPITPPIIELTSDYDAHIQKDGSVVVGCQTITFEKLEEVYLAAKELYEK